MIILNHSQQFNLAYLFMIHFALSLSLSTHSVDFIFYYFIFGLKCSCRFACFDYYNLRRNLFSTYRTSAQTHTHIGTYHIRSNIYTADQQYVTFHQHNSTVWIQYRVEYIDIVNGGGVRYAMLRKGER